MEKVVLHFDFSHLRKQGRNAPLELTFLNANKQAVLREHTPETRLRFKKENRLLGALPQEALDKFTHYAEEATFPSNEVSLTVITYPSKRPGAVAGEIAAMFQYVPRKGVRKAVRLMHQDGTGTAPVKLTHAAGKGLLAGPDLSGPDALQSLSSYHEDASLTVNVISTALAIVMQHPEIASVLADVNYRIAEDIILKDPGFFYLKDYIEDHSDDSDDENMWYKNTVVRDPNGAIMEPASGLTDAEGDTVVWPTLEVDGQQVSVIPQYQLVDELDGVLRPVVLSVLKKIKAAPWLKGSHWSEQNGSTCESSISDQSDPVMKVAGSAPAAPSGDWTLVNKTSEYGLDLFKDSLRYDADSKKLSFDVKNWPNRGLGVYCRFQKAGVKTGEFMSDFPGWDTEAKDLPDAIRKWFESNDTKRYLRYIGAGNVFFGAPVWSPKVELSFPVPAEASTVQVLFGGLGVGHWDMDVDKVGLIYTCIAAYGIPALLSALSVGVSSTSWYKEFFDNPDNVVILVAAAVPCFGVVLGTGAAMGFAIEPILIKAAGFVAGIIFSKLMEKLALKVTGHVTKEILIQNTPVAGLVLKLAGMASAISSMIATTAEVLQSPATYTIEAKRSMDVLVTVNPDVTHGTSTQKAIWPKTGTKYIILVQYEGGSYREETGVLPRVSDEHIEVEFFKKDNKELPMAPDAKLQVIASIYAANNTLVGLWTSGWIPATPGEGTGNLLKVEGSITEKLIPLVPSTRYSHSEQLLYNGIRKKYQWFKPKDAPKATRTALPGQQVSELVNVTINNQAYKLGYCYRASEQNLPMDAGTDRRSTPMYLFRAISTLANPGAGMKTSDRGLSVQPYIAFDQFGPAGLFTLDNADEYMPDLNTKTEVSEALKSVFSAECFPLPDGATVTRITEGGAWSIGVPGSNPLYDLRRQVDVIKVFPWPVPEFSPNNFFLDTRSHGGQPGYHLRLVDLNDNSGANFDFASAKSYGLFPMSHIDAIIIHPNNYAIAISYRDNKLAIVEIPKEGKDERDAPIALPFAGEGLREGLLQGPVALTTTADGRILVLEDLNARIQAFDTRGNCVPCFRAELVFTVAGEYQQDLNGKKASVSLLQSLQQGVPVKYPDNKQRYLLTPVVSIPEEFAGELDDNKISNQLREACALGGITLQAGAQSHCTEPGRLWIVEDAGAGVIYDIRLNAEGTDQIDLYRSMSLTISEKSPRKAWLVADQTNALHFEVRLLDSGLLEFSRLSPVMQLKAQGTATRSYLDIACETKGFIYVLSYGNSGSAPSDYRLDIYNPDGTPLTPDERVNNGQLNAAKFTVDQWRNVFTLNYEQMRGPEDRMEPSISQWIPSVPAPGEEA